MKSTINKLFNRILFRFKGFTTAKVAPQKTINKLFSYIKELREHQTEAERDHELIARFLVKRKYITDELKSKKHQHSKEVIKEILWLKALGKDINPYDKVYKITLLHFVMEGFLDTELLRYFSLRDLKNTGDIFAIAIYNNNIEAIEWLIDNHVSPNAKDTDRDPMLYLAICYDESGQIAKLLIERGAEVNIRNLDGKTPLHVALPRCETNIIKFLLKKGADVNMRDRYNHSTIDKVFINCDRDNAKIIISEDVRLKSLSLLIEHGAEVTRQSIDLIMYRNFKDATTKSKALLLMLGSVQGIKINLKSYFVHQFFTDEDNIKAILDTDGYESQKSIAKENIFKNLQNYARIHNDQKVLGIAQRIFQDDNEILDATKDNYLNCESSLSGDLIEDLDDIT